MPLPTPRTIGAPAAPATDVARHARRAMLSRFIDCPRSLIDLPNIRPIGSIRLIARGASHDRLDATLAKGFSRGFQETAIFFKLVHALSATFHSSRARDARARMQRTPARSPTL